MVMTLTLRDLYPDASEDQLREADRRLDALLRVVLEIVEQRHMSDVDEGSRQTYDGRRSTHY